MIDDFKYRFIEQPGGWIGKKTHPDAPVLVNLRLDPFEDRGSHGATRTVARGFAPSPRHAATEQSMTQADTWRMY